MSVTICVRLLPKYEAKHLYGRNIIKITLLKLLFKFGEKRKMLNQANKVDDSTDIDVILFIQKNVQTITE